MKSGKKIDYEKLRLPVAFIILLLITIVLYQIAFSVDKEALGTEVNVKVTDIKIKSGGLNAGSLAVTVSYQGEEYRLHGVPSNAHFIMENSRKYGNTIKVKLYNGKMYYDSVNIHLFADKLYYASLLATIVVLGAMYLQWKEKR